MTEREPSSGMTERKSNSNAKNIRRRQLRAERSAKTQCSRGCGKMRHRGSCWCEGKTRKILQSSSIATGNPYRDHAIAYARRMGVETVEDKHVIELIRQCGGLERLTKLTPEVQRILLGVSQ